MRENVVLQPALPSFRKARTQERQNRQDRTRPLSPCMGGPMATHGRPRPLHRPSRRVARLSLSLSRGRPTAPYEGEGPYLEIGRTGPCEGETLFPEVGQTPGPCVSPLHRGEQEGSCGAGSLRFPHRLIDPRGERERRSPAPRSFRQSFRKARTQERQNRRGSMIRGYAGSEVGA